MFEAEERRVKRSLLDGELAAGDLLDAEENAVAVKGTERDRLQDEHVEGTLHEVELRGHVSLLLVSLLLDSLGEAKGRFPRLSRRSALEEIGNRKR
jgi:hypothetical protein